MGRPGNCGEKGELGGAPGLGELGGAPGLGELGRSIGEEGVGGAPALRKGVERRRLRPADANDVRPEMDRRDEIDSGRGAALISCSESPRSRSFASAICS